MENMTTSTVNSSSVEGHSSNENRKTGEPKTSKHEHIVSNETKKLGFKVALISWGMLFLTLFMAYTLYRFNAQTWPPVGGEALSIRWPLISTVLAFLSSAFLLVSQKGFSLGNSKVFRVFYLFALSFGILFLISQNQLWNHLQDIGLLRETGIFASILYGFTWIHAGHVGLGLLGLISLSVLFRKDATQYSGYLTRFEMVGQFWHFLGLIWLIMFVGLFLI